MPFQLDFFEYRLSSLTLKIGFMVTTLRSEVDVAR